MAIDERLSTIKAEAVAAGPELDSLVSEAEVDDAVSLRDRLSKIASEADAAAGEIPPPCEHEDGHEHGPVGGESAPGSMPVWDAPDSLEEFMSVAPRRRDMAWCNVHTLTDDPEEGEQLLSLPFPLGDPDPIQFRDIEPRADGVYGAFVFGGNPDIPGDLPGDRHSYLQFWAFGQHRDPGHHNWLRVWRVAVISHGHRVQVNDRSFPERKPQSTHPYPYEEDVSVPPILRDHPGGIVTLTHRRGADDPDARGGRGSRGLGRQPLMRYRVPAVAKAFSPVDGGQYREVPEVGIFYQRNGIFATARSDFETDDNPDGVFARLIFTSLHHAYELHVEPE